MRNLIILNKGIISPESRTYPDLKLVDSIFETVSDTLTCVLSSLESEVIEVQQLMKNGDAIVLASFPSPYPDAKILSFNHFVDSASLVFVFENGDIISANYDPQNPDCATTSVEIVGLIDSGLLASAWSPDEETLAILTRENNLLLLSRLFEPICEKHLNPNDIKITDAKHVSVGWGKEETQFKGKGFKALERERDAIRHAGLDLKEDSQLRDPTVTEVQKGTVSTFDNDTVKISWRGDCEYFAVTTKEEALVESTQELFYRRVVRVFSREGELDSVSEPIDGLEHNLSWRPLGSLIATTQRFTDVDGDVVLNIAFYERNGLRHGEFNTRLNPFEESIVNIEWSANSDVLAFNLRNRVQIWSTKNYHWYLKQEILVNAEDESNEVSFIKFHPEKPLQIMIGTTNNGVQMLNMAYKVCRGPSVIGNDVGMTMVIDGTEGKITPLAIANVPPPISYRELNFPENLSDIATNISNDAYAAITSASNLFICTISLPELKKGIHCAAKTTIESSRLVESNEFVKQVCFIEDFIVAVLIDSPTKSRVTLLDISNDSKSRINVQLSSKAVLLKSRTDFKAAVVECIDGSVWEISPKGAVEFLANFPQLCYEFEVAVYNDGESDTSLPIGISTNGKLFGGDQQLASAVTSIQVTESLLLFTTAQSQVCFVHLTGALEPKNFNFLLGNQENVIDERVRQMERGSVIISCFPSRYSVVLQTPRGNLETICPRIMVLSAVRNYIKQTNYFDAFVACRTHRIDLDLLHDYDPKLFYSNTELFVKQIKRVDYLDLFVSCLHDEDVTLTKYRDTLLSDNEVVPEIVDLSIQPEKNTTRRMIINKEVKQESSKVNKICNAILAVLSTSQYEKEYLQTRITAYACQKPPNLLGALSLIGSFTDAGDMEQAITHLCFLLDVNKLYNHALELYDVKLALNIAQKSQMDPKEYLPFLQNLHIQPQLRKQFMIDDHLKNNEKALQWLYEMGDDSNEEFDEYVLQYSLYKSALSINKYNEERSKQILAHYADYLHEQKNFAESAVTYEYVGQFENSMENYISGKRWKEALSIAEKFNKPEIIAETAQRLSVILVEDHKYAQAAEIEFNFLKNIEEAVRLYCKDYQYESGILLATKEKRTELIESVVDELLGEGFGIIAELLADCKGQVTSQLKRLRELRQKKEEDPFSFYGTPNDDMDTPDNVSVAASETSTTPSFFTRYTGKTAGTAKTGASRKTTKNRKREERKRAKGRKGTIYEEEYLIKSVGRLLERLDLTQADAGSLIEGLIRRKRMQQAYQIQHNWTELITILRENIAEIHNMSEKDRERVDDNGDVYLIDEIPIPEIKDFSKKEILDY